MQQENKMGVMPVNKLLISMSLPMMASMLVQALYNIVDGIFVAQISESALTAVSLAFPIQTLMIAVAGGTTVGINALVSRGLGEKNFERVNKVATNGIFVVYVCYLVFLLVGLFGSKVFYMSQVQNPEIVEYGVTYMMICCCMSFGIFTQFVFEKLLQSTGKTFYTMITQGIGAIINIILDPILIFGYFGLPKMGVAGAAIATVIGQIVAGVIAIILNLKKNHEIKLSFKGFSPSLEIIKQIYVIGLPSIIMQAIGSVMVYGMNLILVAFTETATAVFGVYYKLQSFIFMPVFGLNNGMVPIVAYNYGAGKKERVLKVMKLSITYAVSIMIIGFLAMQIFPEPMLYLFDANEHMLSIGVPALRIISISFIFAGFCIVVGSVFQALGHANYSMIVSIARQLIVLLPVAYALSKLGEVNLVWWSFPIAEIMSVIMTTLFLVRIYKKVISKIGVIEKSVY